MTILNLKPVPLGVALAVGAATGAAASREGRAALGAIVGAAVGFVGLLTLAWLEDGGPTKISMKLNPPEDGSQTKAAP